MWQNMKKELQKRTVRVFQLALWLVNSFLRKMESGLSFQVEELGIFSSDYD